MYATHIYLIPFQLLYVFVSYRVTLRHFLAEILASYWWHSVFFCGKIQDSSNICNWLFFILYILFQEFLNICDDIPLNVYECDDQTGPAWVVAIVKALFFPFAKVFLTHILNFLRHLSPWRVPSRVIITYQSVLMYGANVCDCNRFTWCCNLFEVGKWRYGRYIVLTL